MKIIASPFPIILCLRWERVLYPSCAPAVDSTASAKALRAWDVEQLQNVPLSFVCVLRPPSQCRPIAWHINNAPCLVPLYLSWNNCNNDLRLCVATPLFPNNKTSEFLPRDSSWDNEMTSEFRLCVFLLITLLHEDGLFVKDSGQFHLLHAHFLVPDVGHNVTDICI